jgi:hypothetical protein
MLDQDHLTCFQDPCRTGQPFSILRFAVLTMLFLTMFTGIVFLILLADKPYGIQLSSIVIYTAAVALYTFSANRGNLQPFMLSCPVVGRQLPRLIRRHLGFLAALLILQAIALEVRRHLPADWVINGRNPSAFVVVQFVVCACLAIVQILGNRSLLERAHSSAQ